MLRATDIKRDAIARALVTAGGDVKRAAELASCSPHAIHAALRDPATVALVEQLQVAYFAPGLQNAQITAQRVMLELGRVAFADIRKLYTSDGQLKPVHQLDDDAAAVVSGIKVEVVARGQGEDTEPVITKNIKMADKMGALGLLARHFKLVGDEGDGVNALASALADRLKSARRRIGEEPAQDVDYREMPQQSPPDDYPEDLT